MFKPGGKVKFEKDGEVVRGLILNYHSQYKNVRVIHVEMVQGNYGYHVSVPISKLRYLEVEDLI